MNEKQKTRRRFLFALFICCVLGFIPTHAQQIVTGSVVDQNGDPVPGVSIVKAGTTIGVMTDYEGNFSIQANNGEVLNVTSIGFVSQQIRVKGNRLRIVIAEDTELLEEVVVVGYGTMKKKDLTGSVNSISGKTLVGTGQTSTLSALRGQQAGVSVTQANGKLGAGYNIEIRGMNSINKSSAPLCVVDGVVGGDINAINPADIERIDVLKDVSAAAIYGSRGANGVIIVTTKSGRQGKNRITYDGSYGITTPSNLPEMFNGEEYVAYAKEAIRGGSNHDPFIGKEKENADAGRFTDWLDYTLENGYTTSHTIGLSGGNEKETHLFSVGYVKQTGNIHGEQSTRLNFKMSIEGKVGNFTLGLSAYGRYQDIDNGSKEALRSAFRLRPIAQPTDENGNDQFFVQTYRPDRFMNPRFDAKNENTNIRHINAQANFFIDYKIMEGLNIRSSVSPYVCFDRTGYYADTFTKAQKGSSLPKADLTNNNNYSYSWDNTITYNHVFEKKHSVNVMLGTSTYKYSGESSYIAVKDMPYNFKWDNLSSAGTETSRSSGESTEKLVSFMGRLNYSYDDRYLITLTGRSDGSSKLAPGHKWGFFPSAALAWRVSNEGFLKDNETINDLKIRLSYGVSGNNVVGAYSTMLGVTNTYYDFGGADAKGQYLNRIPNYDLGWEKSKEWNLGIDFALFNSRISGTIDLYNKKNVDLILAQSIPQTNGFSSVDAVNIGSTRNKGIEVGLNTINIKTRNFLWRTNITFATNKNEIIDIFGDKQDYPDQALFIGKPVKVIYDYDWNGIWQIGQEAEASKYGRQPGEVREVDQNDDGQITPDKDRVILGNPFPKWTGSITNTFVYKDFDLSIFIYTRQGEFKFSKFHNELQNEYLGEINQLKVDYWTPENPSNTFYRPGFNTGNKGLLLYKDFSFVRVGNITLGYTLPSKWISKAKLSEARIYFTAINPIIFTDYTGLDPEFGGYATNSGNSNDTATYNGGVAYSTYMFGINLTF